MKGKPLVSVLLPCYNAEKFLEEAVDTIMIQTYDNIEIILINDGSTDSTLNICNRLSEKNKSIKLLNIPKNVGLISALNQGIAYASGKFIARMDADDLSTKDRIESLLQIFEDNEAADLVSSANIVIGPDKRFLQSVKPKGTLPKSLKFVSLFCTPVVHGSVMAKTHIFKSNPYEHDYIHSEDYRLFSKLALSDYNIYNTPKILYKLRLNPESVSNKYENIQISTHQKISRQNITAYFGESPSDKVLPILINRFNEEPSIAQIKEVFKTIDNYKNIFIKREACNSIEIKEINTFIVEQKLDILIQSFKYSQGTARIIKLLTLIFNFKTLYTFSGIKYIYSKISKQINKSLKYKTVQLPICVV